MKGYEINKNAIYTIKLIGVNNPNINISSYSI